MNWKNSDLVFCRRTCDCDKIYKYHSYPSVFKMFLSATSGHLQTSMDLTWFEFYVKPWVNVFHLNFLLRPGEEDVLIKVQWLFISLVNAETFSQSKFLETTDMLPSFSKPKSSIVPYLKVKRFCNWTKQPTVEFSGKQTAPRMYIQYFISLASQFCLTTPISSPSGLIHSYGK